MKPFNIRIQNALADTNLQAALDANAERRIAVRCKAFASLEDAAALRQRAHAVRAEVIANLDKYLEQFIGQAQENGLLVHRAADAAEAVQCVLEIARKHQVQLVAKSKTMVGEEIGLNHALEAAGLQVIETDLGEYIVQLRGEPPSHIITPAVHLRRQDVGRLFHQKLGLPLTEDISDMTAAARRVLRDVFLRAEMGISGVNFGVAESGTLCLLTNEGNGRMVTTLPPVHVALMGMERLVPTLDDLALMLALLPRSATGQKITVYASLLHGPRRPPEPDGPQERHLVIVDNGRSALRRSPLAEILYCIRCGACLNACPVFREIGGHAYVGAAGQINPYPGPMGSVLSPALFGQDEFGHLARASSLCGACREACPVEIDLPRLLLRVRAGQRQKPNAPPLLSLGLHLFTWVAVSPRRFAIAQRLAGWLGSLAVRRGQGDEQWLRLPAFTGWGLSKDFPSPAPRPFRRQFRQKLLPQSTAELPPHPLPPQEPLAKVEPPSSPPSSDLVARFAAELQALGGIFIPASEQALPEQILAWLSERNIRALLAWDEAFLPPGLLRALRQSGIVLYHPSAPDHQTGAGFVAGLTAAIAAAAETASLLIAAGPGRPLTASLLPEIHLVVLRKEDLWPSLKDLLKRPEVRQASAAVLISGPSRTADIEMTLTIGVHGPGTLAVYCL